MKTRLLSLNGKLLDFLGHISLVSKYRDSCLISNYHEFDSIANDLSKLVKECRKNGYDWLFSETDIYEDEESSEIRLPSVDIACFMSEDGNNNNLESIFKKNGIHTNGIDWDTERSAWYPRFKDKEYAKNFIVEINKYFDKKFLKKNDRSKQ